MLFQVRESDESCQPGPQYRNPQVVVQEHHGAPLLNCSGLVLVRQLIERLGVAHAIDAGVRMLRRCKWYRESDHILTLVYSMLSGGSKLQDVNRLGQDDALKRVLGSDRIPHATTIGKFLWRFGNDEHDQQRLGLTELRETTQAVQQDAFVMLARERRKVATLDWDSSIHEVYGQKKEGADYAYDNRWSYNALYATLAETGDVLYLGLREGYRHTSYGTKEVLPGTIERVSKHFRQVRMRADSGYYSQALVQICEAREVEFFIVAKQHRNLMNAVREIPESQWKSFAESNLHKGDRGRRRRQRRENLKRKITKQRKPNSRFKGAPEVAGHDVQANELEEGTPIRDQTDANRRQGRPAIVPGRRTAPVPLLDRGEQLEAQQRAGVANRAGAWQPGELDQGLQVRAGPGPYTYRLAGGESSLLHDRGTGLELEDVAVESARPRGWRGDAFPAVSVSVDLASRGGSEERSQYGRAQTAGG